MKYRLHLYSKTPTLPACSVFLMSPVLQLQALIEPPSHPCPVPLLPLEVLATGDTQEDLSRPLAGAAWRDTLMHLGPWGEISELCLVCPMTQGSAWSVLGVEMHFADGLAENHSPL